LLSWAWIPITLAAALAQTLRNAAQRHLTADLGALGATLVRFFYGLPFALTWLLIAWLAITPGQLLPGITASFLVWTVGRLADPDRGDRPPAALHGGT
jgi:hypothetical protein